MLVGEDKPFQLLRVTCQNGSKHVHENVGDDIATLGPRIDHRKEARVGVSYVQVVSVKPSVV